MMSAAIIDSLALPASTRVDRRIPKKLLAEQGRFTAADKRQIQDGIEELLWIAAIKPTNVGVPIYRDDSRDYLEVAVLLLKLRPLGKESRLAQIVHRSVPYPVFLVIERQGDVLVSLAHKRLSESGGDQSVLEEERSALVAGGNPPEKEHVRIAPDPEEAAFLGAIAIAELPRTNLRDLYQGWMDRLAALEAARITGEYGVPANAQRASELSAGVETHKRLVAEIATLRSAAARETQINRRVDLNLNVKRLEAELASLANTLRQGSR